jgi:hypothetical protein
VRYGDGDSFGGPYPTSLVLVGLLLFCLYRGARSLGSVLPLGTEGSGLAMWRLLGYGGSAFLLYALMTGGAV